MALVAAAARLTDPERGRPEPERVEIDLPLGELRHGSTEPAKVAQTAAPDLPRAVSQQIVEAARHLRHGPVELTLSPEELGKVRLTLTAEGGAMTLAVHAERQDTLDLLRRNVEQLAADFREMGFSNLNFSFSRDDSQGARDREHGDATGRPEAPQPIAAQTLTIVPLRLGIATESGLDLRL